MSCQMKRLNRYETADIYEKWIHRHFPQDEIKPLKSIYRMWDMGCYSAVGIYTEPEDDGVPDFVGYAFFVSAPDSSQILLDYLAVVEKYRSHGIGSVFLKQAKEILPEYKGILIETEDVEFAENEEERRVRDKRDSFYERNGALRTGVKGEVYGVRYAIWDFPLKEAAKSDECRENLEKIYKIIVPGEKYEKHVKIL